MKRVPLYFASLLVVLGLTWLTRSLEADGGVPGDATRGPGEILRERVDRQNGGALLILAGIVSVTGHRWGVTGAALSLAAVSMFALGFLMLGPLRAYEGLRRGAHPTGGAVVTEDELRAVCLHDASLPLLASTAGGAVAVALARVNGRATGAAGGRSALVVGALVLGALVLGASGLIWALYGEGILGEVL